MYTNLRLMELFVLFVSYSILFRVFLHDLVSGGGVGGGMDRLEKSRLFMHVNCR